MRKQTANPGACSMHSTQHIDESVLCTEEAHVSTRVQIYSIHTPFDLAYVWYNTRLFYTTSPICADILVPQSQLLAN